jgi:aminoglycoside phosphotransferase
MPLTDADARSILRGACDVVGIDYSHAEPIRLGENALFISRNDDVVIRIARSMEIMPDARKEIAIARWLRGAGIAVTTPLDLGQPVIVQDHPVTFWQVIPDSGDKIALPDMARILKQLHSLPVPAGVGLPALDMFGRVGQRIESAGSISNEIRRWLLGRLDQLREDYAGLSFDLEPCAVHGDAHIGNFIVPPEGAPVMIDLERFAFGQPEADLTVTATEALVGWHAEEDYRAFADAYGYDVISWPGFPVMRAANELKMTTWLMQNVGEDPRIAAEFENRLACLRNDDTPRNWAPF